MHRRILAPVAAAALAFGLVACGDTGGGTVTTPPPSIDIGGGSDDGGAEPSDGGSGASDGGGESPVAAPDIPAPDPADYPGMDQNTPEGAEQAFKYYIAVMTWGYQTGDDSPLSAQHLPSCGTCKKNAEAIRTNSANGKYWSSTTVEEGSSAPIESASFDIEIAYEFHLSEHTEPSEDGKAVEEHPRTKYTSVAGMNWEDEQWKIGAIAIETEDSPDA